MLIIMLVIKHSLAIGSFVVDELFVNRISNFHVVAPPPTPRSFTIMFFLFLKNGDVVVGYI
jgi:hypothetical protein